MKNKNRGGIEGWLLVYTIALILHLLFFFYLAYLWINDIGGIDMVVIIPSLIIFTYALLYIFIKNKSAPKLNIFALWAWFILVLISTWFNRYNLGIGTFLIGTLFRLIWVMVWVRYWKDSKRVKNTFVNED